MANWVDISSHSQGDKERAPKSFELKIAGLSVRVTRHIHYGPTDWLIYSPGFIVQHKFCEGVCPSDAKDEAVKLVRAELELALSELPL